MADTTSITFTFADTETLETAWIDYCQASGVDYSDAATAESNGVDFIKSEFVRIVANYRARVAAEAEQESTYSSETASFSGL